MKKKIILLMLAVVLLFGCQPEQAPEPLGIEMIEEAEPLVIETPERARGFDNPYQGTVTIVTPYKESECWAGLIYINEDGDNIRITVFDAVESYFDEVF